MSAEPVRSASAPLPDAGEVCQRLAEQMLSLAMQAGADAAEVLVRDGTELEVKVRLGEPELVKEAGSRALGLRVLKDSRSAVTYTSDFSRAGLERFARESVELAALAEPDPTGALPRPRADGARRPGAGSVGRGGAAVDRARGDGPRASAARRRRSSPTRASPTPRARSSAA